MPEQSGETRARELDRIEGPGEPREWRVRIETLERAAEKQAAVNEAVAERLDVLQTAVLAALPEADRLRDGNGAEQSEPDGMNEVRAYITAGRKIDAVRVYRQIHGCFLKDAKTAVEAMMAQPSVPAPLDQPEFPRVAEEGSALHLRLAIAERLGMSWQAAHNADVERFADLVEQRCKEAEAVGRDAALCEREELRAEVAALSRSQGEHVAQPIAHVDPRTLELLTRQHPKQAVSAYLYNTAQSWTSPLYAAPPSADQHDFEPTIPEEQSEEGEGGEDDMGWVSMWNARPSHPLGDAAERDRMREALRLIAGTTWPAGFSISAAQGMIEIARRALTPEQHPLESPSGQTEGLDEATLADRLRKIACSLRDIGRAWVAEDVESAARRLRAAPVSQEQKDERERVVADFLWGYWHGAQGLTVAKDGPSPGASFYIDARALLTLLSAAAAPPVDAGQPQSGEWIGPILRGGGKPTYDRPTRTRAPVDAGQDESRAADELWDALNELVTWIGSSRKLSIGSIDNNYETQVGVGAVERYRALLRKHAPSPSGADTQETKP